MKALITLIDDNGERIGPYELYPSKVNEIGISSHYIFSFEYAKLDVFHNTIETASRLQEGDNE